MDFVMEQEWLICKGFEANVIHVEITMGQNAGRQVLILRIPMSPVENEGYPFHFKHAQIFTTRKMINNDAFYASRKAKDDASLKRPLRLCHYMC